MGCWIFGAGRFTTKIENGVSGGTILATDGFQFSTIERIAWQVSGTGSTCLLLNHFTSGYFPAQSNTISDCHFNGADYGVSLASGHDGSSFGQGSEIIFINCFFGSCGVYGLGSRNSNSLQITVLGGNFQTCGVGIDSRYGSINRVDSVGFQQQTDCDIKVENQSSNIMFITACRTESSNFIKNPAGQSLTVIGCHQFTPTPGVARGNFIEMAGGMHFITGCIFNGQVTPSGWTRLCMSACDIEGEAVANDWLVKVAANWRVGADNGGQDPQMVLELENIISYCGVTQDTPKIYKQRLYSNDASTILTKNYTVA
jgi:hypothetical protein